MAYGFRRGAVDLESIFIVSGSATGFGSSYGFKNSSGTDIGTRMWDKAGAAGTNNVPHAYPTSTDSVTGFKFSNGDDITTGYRTHNTSCDGLNSATYSASGTFLLSSMAVPWSSTRRYNIKLVAGGGGGGGGCNTIGADGGGGGGGGGAGLFVHNVQIYNESTCHFVVGSGGGGGSGGTSSTCATGYSGIASSIDVAGNTSYPLSVAGGGGGTRGTVTVPAGGPGGSTSTAATYCSAGSYLLIAGATGGQGGDGGSIGNAGGGGVSARSITATGLTLSVATVSGGAYYPSVDYGGGGGSGCGGVGGTGSYKSGNGDTGSSDGGGGGGGSGYFGVATDGGAGGRGSITIYWSTLVSY